MAPIQHITSFNLVLLLIVVLLLSKVIRLFRRRANPTQLKGPESKSLIFGVSHLVSERDENASLVYEQWAERYGGVFRIPIAMGDTKVVLCDPKAIQHFASKDTVGYVRSARDKTITNNVLGKGISWADGESHKRQRRAMLPAFSNAAIRQMVPVFIDSAYKVKEAWDTLLESSIDGEAVIDVQDWMNHVSLDSLGIAGFSHDFGTLLGKHSKIAEVIESFGMLKQTGFQLILLMLSTPFPFLARTPSPENILWKKFRSKADEISMELLERTKQEQNGNVQSKRDNSVIELLIKASSDRSGLQISEAEVMAQLRLLIIAGYETTSVSLTWALVELSKNPSIQTKLRDEIVCQCRNGSDITYDQLTGGFPYLNAVVHEVLRVHAPLWEIMRTAAEDDIIPLSVPLQTADNKTVDRISIAAGQLVTIPIRTMNRSTNIWGPDAKEFRPERWLEEGGIHGNADSIQGYHHLLTFSDGPRICLGRSFALAEFKAVLSVLVRNYAFQLRDGPNTKFNMGRMLLPRPKVAGEDGCRLPLRIRRVD